MHIKIITFHFYRGEKTRNIIFKTTYLTVRSGTAIFLDIEGGI
jgi:hypothetical protein